MANATIKAISVRIRDAFLKGNTSVILNGKKFVIERVYGAEWRLTDDHNTDLGLRFTASHGKLSFFMA